MRLGENSQTLSIPIRHIRKIRPLHQAGVDYTGHQGAEDKNDPTMIESAGFAKSSQVQQRLQRGKGRSMDASNSFPVNILLVEDDEVDIENVRRIFERRKIGNPLFVARDGQEAQALLQNGTVRSPALVLLDIGLPRMDGIEFLTWMRSEPEHESHVVFIFTVSDKQTDLYRAYDLNVSGYMLKSEVGDSFIEAVELIEDYWRVIEAPVN